jgi:hypothetical protein
MLAGTLIFSYKEFYRDGKLHYYAVLRFPTEVY